MQAFCNDRSVKIFAAALTYLAKCGKDISLEATTDGVRPTNCAGKCGARCRCGLTPAAPPAP